MAGNIIAAIPTVQLIVKIATAMGFRVIMACIISGWSIEKIHVTIETVRREVKEETQLEDLDILSGFKKTIKYFFRIKGENIFKIVVFYLGKSKEKEVKISEEHIGYDWLSYEKALALITFDNSKEILKEAHNFLKDYVRQKGIF